MEKRTVNIFLAKDFFFKESFAFSGAFMVSTVRASPFPFPIIYWGNDISANGLREGKKIMSDRNNGNTAPSRGALRLNNRLRKLWPQHVYRTRFFIISTASELADLPFVTKWLLRNPGDFAAALEPFYGKARADWLRQLLTDHLMIAGELVNAAKNHETAKVELARKRWYGNADEIAEFLAKINPYWSREKWTKLLYDHLRMTEREAVLRLSGKYPEDIAEFGSIENEALEMADYMLEGMIRQFRLN